MTAPTKTVEKIHQKIAKLLALSTSSNPAEAAAAAAKAHAILRDHNLKVEDLEVKPYPLGHDVEVMAKEMKWKTIIMNAIATANYCVFVSVKDYGKTTYRLFGREHNVESAKVIYDYLISAVDRITDETARRHTIERYQFRLGAAIGIAQHLRELTWEESTTALVPLNTEALAAAEEAGAKDYRVPVSVSSISASWGYREGKAIGLDPQVSHQAATRSA